MATIREALESAHATLSGEPDETAPPEPTTEGTSEAAPEAEAKPSDSSETPEAARPAETKEAKETPAGRDEKGRFQKPGPSSATAKPTQAPALTNGKGPAIQKPGDAPAPVKAPKGWNPDVWSKAAPEVQASIARREREFAMGMQEAAPLKQQMQKWSEVTAPFEAMVRSQGADMHSTVDNLLRTQYALYTAPPAGKAQIVANIISQFGIDPGHVASFLQGQVPQGAQPPIDPNAIAQQVRQQIRQDLTQQQEQTLLTRASSDWEQFRGEHEFADELSESMAGLLEAKLAHSFEDAYDKAAKLHPDISGYLAQREAAKQAQAANASTQRARAASTLKSTPAGPTGAVKGTDLRSVLERTYDTLASGRR